MLIGSTTVRARARITGALAAAAAVATLAAITSGCAPVPVVSPEVQDYDPRLLTGETVFGQRVSAGEAPDVVILRIDDAMQAFIDGNVEAKGSAAHRFRLLMHGLEDHGYITDYSYDADRTATAIEAFNQKIGNCLSYTNMFIALARAAGLSARYQIVDVPDSWDADSGYLILYSHINVLLEGVRLGRSLRPQVTVDFNAEQPASRYPRRLVSDDYATALFYSNRSVEFWRQGETRRGFAYLLKALELTPYNVDLWLNLGAFYAKQDQPWMSILARQHALSLDPSNEVAMAGLARAHAELGEHERSGYYADQVRESREKNAYYHFAMAQRAYQQAEYEQSMQFIETAIRLRKKDSRFYSLRGLLQEQRGDLKAAENDFRRAERLSRTGRVETLFQVPIRAPGRTATEMMTQPVH